MKRLSLFLAVVFACSVSSAQKLNERVVHNDPANYKLLSAVHAGAGKMKFTELIGRNALTTNFLYLHAGEIAAKSGIGQHFHHTIEEMYVILDGEAEFTVNGRTSLIKAPALVPCKMGDAHGIYNASEKPLRWLNFAVSSAKAKSDNFDLGDNRVGASVEAIPQFVSARLNAASLRNNNTFYSGDSLRFRRLFGPDVFSTSWNHVDHLVIRAGATAGPKQTNEGEEVYYVIKGTGIIRNGADQVSIGPDDSFFTQINESLQIANTGTNDLELLVIGISSNGKRTAPPKAMVLQMDFVVTSANSDAFEKMYNSIYVPAMLVQQGYLSSKLLRLYPAALSKQIEAEPTEYNYQIQISFDTELNRRKWVASPQHQIAWPAATSLAKSFKWRGYDVAGENDN